MNQCKLKHIIVFIGNLTELCRGLYSLRLLDDIQICLILAAALKRLFMFVGIFAMFHKEFLFHYAYNLFPENWTIFIIIC